jgi:hypothetical protein
MASVEDKATYDKTEIDNMIKETKTALESKINELVSVGNTPSAPTSAASTLSFTILKSETE